MLTTKLKLISAAALAALLLLPALRAEAWQYVCLDNRGHYSARLNVIYGFDKSDNDLPHFAGHWTLFNPRGRPVEKSRRGEPIDAFPDMRRTDKLGEFDADEVARGLVQSLLIPIRQHKCVDIGGLAEGEAFFATVATDRGFYGGDNWALCDTHESNPLPFYAQRSRPYNEIWFRSGGVDWSPRCDYFREHNP